jgi:hypothetical protein
MSNDTPSHSRSDAYVTYLPLSVFVYCIHVFCQKELEVMETRHGFAFISGKMAASCVRRQYCLIKGGHIRHPHSLFTWKIDSSVLYFSPSRSWHQLTLFTLALLLAIPPNLQAQPARQYSCASRLCVGVTVQTFGILLTLAGFLILAHGDNVNIGRSPVQNIVPWQGNAGKPHITFLYTS